MRHRGTALGCLAAVLVAAPVLLAGADPARPAEPASTSADEVARLRRGVEQNVSGLEQRLGELQQEAKQVDERILARGRSYVRMTRAGLLPVGEGFEALVEHATRLERIHHALESDLARAKELAAERIELGKKLGAARARADTLSEEERVLSRAEDALRAEDERQRAFAQAFDASGHTAVYGAVGPTDSEPPASGFASLKGRLPFPIAGRAEITPARRASSDGPGLEMRAAAGTPVRAVANGRVAFADSYADYGKTIIVEHGRRYYTLSANLGTIDVAVGDEVSAGQKLGTVGDAGKGARLYFEIRVGRETVNPGPWFGI